MMDLVLLQRFEVGSLTEYVWRREEGLWREKGGGGGGGGVSTFVNGLESGEMAASWSSSAMSGSMALLQTQQQQQSFLAFFGRAGHACLASFDIGGG